LWQRRHEEVSTMLVTAYLFGWVLAMIGVLGAALPASEILRPGPLTRGFVAVLVGALWPIVVLGLVEMAVIWALASVTRAADARHSRHAPKPVDEAVAA
jgi:hypothetical protein